MTDKRETIQMDRIIDLLVDDLFSISDKDILAEAAEEYGDIKTEAGRLQTLAQGTVFNHGRVRFEAAKKAIAAKRDMPKKQLCISSLKQKQQIINSIRNSNDNLRHVITMAARSENDLSENDIDAYLQSLFELGAIDEQGNVLCED